jgi:hypothetical protein
MADEAKTVTPEMEALVAAVKIIKDANPDMGAPKVHKAVKDANPTWQVTPPKHTVELTRVGAARYIEGNLCTTFTPRTNTFALACSFIHDFGIRGGSS